MKNKKGIKAAAALVSAALLLAGCAASDSSSVSQTSSAAEVTTTTTAATTAPPETTTTEATTTTAPLMPPMKEAAEVLKGFEINGNVGKIVAGADNTIAFQCIEDDSTTIKIYVYDPISDSIVRTLEPASDTEALVGTFENGTLVTSDYNNGVMLKYYRKGKSKPEVIDTGESFLYDFMADYENNSVCWLSIDTMSVIRIDNEGKKTEIKPDGDISELSDPDIYENYFIATKFDENSETGYAKSLYSFDECKKIMDITDCDWNSFMTSQGFIYPAIDPADASSRRYLLELTAYDSSNSKRYVLETDESTYYSFSGSADSDYAAVMKYVSSESNDFGTVQLEFIDLKNSKLANVDTEGKPVSMEALYLRDLRRFFVAMTFADDKGVTTKLLMTDPAALDYKTDIPTEPIPAKAEDSYKVGEKFKEVREAADKIEQKYGVRILVGNEVKLSERSAQYIFETREELDDPYVIEDELYYLSELDKLLGFYPKGFFDHFKTENGSFGLRLSLVNSLKNDEFTDFEAGGIAFTSGLWYDIAIKTTMLGSKDASLHHEMWHSVENILNSKGLFDEFAWDEFNPEGFTYTSDFDKYATDAEFNETLLEYALTNKTGNTDDVYFVSSYSTVTAMEDRATLIEQVTSIEWDYDNDLSDYLFGTENMAKYPHLKAKLDFLAELSKKEFGCVYWENIEKELAKIV